MVVNKKHMVWKMCVYNLNSFNNRLKFDLADYSNI
jgi:hypothetical protein